VAIKTALDVEVSALEDQILALFQGNVSAAVTKVCCWTHGCPAFPTALA
jgi:hypothetical protein